MKKTISLVLSLVMLLSVATFGTQAFAADYVADSDARAMITTVNDFRTGSDTWYWNEDNTPTKVVQSNLKKYTYDENLEKIAKIRAEEISRSYPDNFSHTRPDGTSCFTCTATDANGNEVGTYAENIACGTNMTADEAFNAWLEYFETYEDNIYLQQGHRRNMLNAKLTCIGIAGYTADDGNVYWVQEFGYELSAQSGDSAPGGSQTVAKPAKTAIKTIKGAKKSIKLSWKKVTKNNTGYEIQVALDKNFKKGKKTATIKSAKTASTTVKKLKAKKKYFVRIRCYRTIKGTKYYSKWSAVKSVKTKG